MIKPISILLLILSVAVTCKHRYNSITDGSKVTMKWNETIFKLDYGFAYSEDRNLRMSFGAPPDSNGKYEVEITKKGDEIVPQVIQTWSITDCLYVVSDFKILSQKILLDKAAYSKGDKIEGTLNLLALGREDYFKEPGENTLRQNYDTVRISGAFKLKVQ